MNTLHYQQQLPIDGIAQSVSLNNQGASFIESGDYLNAVNALRLALQACRQHGCKDTSSSSVLRGGEEHQERTSIMHHPSLDECMTWSTTTRPSSSSDDRCGRNNYSSCSSEVVFEHELFYKNPIKLPRPTSSISHPYYNDIHSNILISISIVFNLALTHHKAGLKLGSNTTTTNSNSNNGGEIMHHEQQQDSNSSRRHLEKAAKFYQTLFPLLQRAECQQHGSRLFTMVVLNNMGHIYYPLNEEEKARHYFQQLLSALMFTMVHNNGYQNNNDIDDDDEHTRFDTQFDIFFHSTLYLIFPNSIQVARAA